MPSACSTYSETSYNFVHFTYERSDFYFKPIKGFIIIIRAITVAKTKEMFKKIITAHTKYKWMEFLLRNVLSFFSLTLAGPIYLAFALSLTPWFVLCHTYVHSISIQSIQWNMSNCQSCSDCFYVNRCLFILLFFSYLSLFVSSLCFVLTTVVCYRYNIIILSR